MGFFGLDDSDIFKQIFKLVALIIFVISLAWLIVFFFGKNIINNGISMHPVIEDKDTVMIDKFSYCFSEPQRYDIIAFYLDNIQESDTPKISIKRIIGLPGEKIQIKEGRVFIDGTPLESDMPYVNVDLSGIASDPVILEENEYFVLGDNNNASEDSRFINIGNILKDNIIGRAWIISYPYSRLKILK